MPEDQKGDLTITDVAKQLRRGRSAVLALIHSGQLEAYDASCLGDRNKAYRITIKALARFKEERAVVVNKCPTPKGLPTVKDFV